MTLLETLALLTLLATVGFGMFDIAWKIFTHKKLRPSSQLVRSLFIVDMPERC